MSRDELLKIFHSYAMPLHRRSSTRNKNADHQMDTLELTLTEQSQASGNKYKRITYASSPTPHTKCSDNSKSMDLVTNGCKKIKIGPANCGTSENKRGIEDLKVDPSFSQKSKRQKITWP